MGTLQSALRSKALTRCGDNSFRVGSCSMQGSRISMEDAHSINMSLPNHPQTAFFGVFDGHGGKEASLFVEREIINAVDALEDFSDENLKALVTKLDAEFIKEENAANRENGTTCVFALVDRSSSPPSSSSDGKESSSEEISYNVTCSNLGDSRCLLVRSDGSFEPLSEDHKPDNEEERTRIENAGGSVSAGRVDGNLAVSRAIGDWSLKSNPDLKATEQKVSCDPEIRHLTLHSDDLLFLSCDGIFEHLTNDQVVQIIHQNYNPQTRDPAKTLTYLFERSLDSGSTDNMSSVLVQISNGTEYNEADQYLPGPLFNHRSSGTFLDAFITDANLCSYHDGPLLRLMAYEHDIRRINTDSACMNNPSSSGSELKLRIEKEMNTFDLDNLGIDHFAEILNSQHCCRIVKDLHVAALRNVGVTTVNKLRLMAEEEDKWKSLDIPSDVKDALEHLATRWADFPLPDPSNGGDSSSSEKPSGEDSTATSAMNFPGPSGLDVATTPDGQVIVKLPDGTTFQLGIANNNNNDPQGSDETSQSQSSQSMEISEEDTEKSNGSEEDSSGSAATMSED